MRTIALDVETTKVPVHHPWLPGALLVAVGLADETGWRKTWVFNHQESDSVWAEYGRKTHQQMIAEIQAELNKADRIVGHNLKFDLNWMRYAGINFDHCKLWCTQVVEYLLRGQQKGRMTLADLSKQYLTVDKMDRMKTFWDAGYETTEIPLSILIPYLEQDCINALAVYQHQVPEVQAKGLSALAAIQCETTRVLSDIECNGMRFNLETANKYCSEMKESLTAKDAALLKAFGWDVNLDSKDELSVALYGGVLKREGLEWVIRELKYDSKYYQRKCIVKTPMEGVGFAPPEDAALKKEGYYSTDKGTIKRLKAKTKKLRTIKTLLKERSKEKKAVETFAGKKDSEGKGLINKVQRDGCLHSQYTQTVTITGRLSSRDPNGQNLPRKGTSPIKLAIIPRYDWILNADLSQIEWRVGAFLSQDPVMLQEIADDVDCHTDNAIRFFKADPKDKNFGDIRTVAKIMTFRLLYGGSAYGFYMDHKMPDYSLKRWQEIVDAFNEKYKGLKAWQEQNLRSVYINKGILHSPTGRFFHIEKTPKGYNKRMVCNYPVQAMATADIMPLAMTLIHKTMRKHKIKSKVIGQAHDSLVFDVVDDELVRLGKMCVYVFEALPKYIEKLWGIRFNVKLGGECEYGKNYGDLKELKLD